MDKDLKKVSTDESCKESALRKVHKWGVKEVESRESFWFLKKWYLKNNGMCMMVEVQWITEKIASAYSWLVGRGWCLH